MTPGVPAGMAINYRTVHLSVQERAMADFAVKVTEQPGKLELADIKKLRDAGLSDAKIFYVIEMAAIYTSRTGSCRRMACAPTTSS